MPLATTNHEYPEIILPNGGYYGPNYGPAPTYNPQGPSYAPTYAPTYQSPPTYSAESVPPTYTSAPVYGSASEGVAEDSDAPKRMHRRLMRQ